MFRFLYKFVIAVILIASIFLSVNYFFLDTQASIALKDTFVASETNMSNISAQSSDITGAESRKVFNEYTEATIDKMGFYIRIDKINLFKMVVKDVDPRYPDVYQKSWELGVSHGKFTSYPDQIGITYIFGHASGDKSTAASINAWFSNLDQLTTGDQIILYYQGKKYFYDVTQIRAVSPTATGFYTGVSPVSMVRLQYCGPPTGSLDSRTLVDAVLIDTQTL